MAAAQGRFTTDDYLSVLDEYLHTHSEDALYRASLLSRELVVAGLGPEDIVALHSEALTQAAEELPPLEQIRAMNDGHQFLLEVMIGYGVHYREYLELKLSEGLRDLETRVSLEEERLLEAERIGREKDEILAVIAHELRQPLTAAQSHLDLVERFLKRGEVQQAPTHLLSARQALERLSRLSGDLVEASRQELPVLRFVFVDLHEILTQALSWIAPAASAKGLGIIQNCDSESPVRVWANADALLSVFGNLLSNAVRYTPAGGNVTLTLTVDAGYARVDVRDTGIGMSPEVLGRIFERFYRAPEARQIETRGLGLGLALVRQLVEAHQGRVEVESTPLHGSMFRVLLPVGPIEHTATEVTTS
ncbi:MAG: two-component system, OmpR family, phosphate regulon sensor histidine kinase PhoR [Chloroflexota bacterium]|jgi:signal transduction histidine kinase|nr:two-component system, OmpR family, phosphate regulon sensor histidine kinase PhoR [Chloroflexota bacterium]